MLCYGDAVLCVWLIGQLVNWLIGVMEYWSNGVIGLQPWNLGLGIWILGLVPSKRTYPRNIMPCYQQMNVMCAFVGDYRFEVHHVAHHWEIAGNAHGAEYLP